MRKGYFKNRGITLLAAIAIGGVLGLLGIGVVELWRRTGGLVGWILELVKFLAGVALSATSLLFNLLSQFAAIIINFFIILDPFGQFGAASILWEFFKNISYVVIVFLALIAGFEWILNREDEAKRMLFGILIIAFLINFTFILAKELFMAVWYLQRGILQSAGLYDPENKDISRLGDLIYASLSLVPPKAMVTNFEALIPGLAEASGETSPGAIHNMRVALVIAIQLLGILLNVVYSLIMWIFAGISIGRFLIISFLVGILPLACVAYTTPWYRNRWGQWWQMFLTWNFNILILIILIIIGVSLIAINQEKFNEQTLANLFIQQQKASGLLQNITQETAMLLGVIIKFAFIAIYFLFVLFAALRLGSRAAEYSYRLGLGLWGLAGGALLWAGKEFTGKPALDKLGAGLETLGGYLAMSRFNLIRNLGTKVQGLGSELRKPKKKEAEEQARAIWEQIKDKSPEEIARIIQRYPAPLQKELAKLAEREKGADEIIQIAGNLDLQKAAKTGVLKNLCGRTFDCNLTRLVTGDQEEKIRALNQIASRMDWRSANLSHLSRVLSRAGIDEEQHPLLIRNMYTYIPNKRNFWTPENIRWLRDHDEQDFINANLGSIQRTLAYRAVVREGAKDIAQVLNRPDLEKTIEGVLHEKFLEGKLEEDLLQSPDQLINAINQRIGQQLQPTLSEENRKILQENLVYIQGYIGTYGDYVLEDPQDPIQDNIQEIARILSKTPDEIKKSIKDNIGRLQEWAQDPDNFLQYLGIPTHITPPSQISLDEDQKSNIIILLTKLRGALKTPPPVGREAEWGRRLIDLLATSPPQTPQSGTPPSS